MVKEDSFSCLVGQLFYMSKEALVAGRRDD